MPADPETSKAPRKRRWVLAVIGIIGAIGLASASYALLAVERDDVPAAMLEAATAGPKRVTTALVARRPIEQAITTIGTIRPRDEIAIGTSVEGQRIAEVLVEEGDWVEQGQLLVRLETDVLASLVEALENRVDYAEAAVAQQEAVHAEAQDNYRRVQALRERGVASDQQHDERRTARINAGHLLTARRAELAEARAQLAEARIRLERTNILAPTAGLITERNARIGALATADPLLRIIRQGEMEVEAEIAEADLPAVAAGDRASVEIPGITHPLTGTVRLVSPRIDDATRLGTARIALGNDRRLRAGAFARVTIERGERLELVIPQTAILYAMPGQPPSVFVLNAEGRAERRPVVIDTYHQGLAVLGSGLAEGEQVVLGAAAFLREGETVTPVPADEGAAS